MARVLVKNRGPTVSGGITTPRPQADAFGELPGIGMARTGRSRNTPPAARIPEVPT